MGRDGGCGQHQSEATGRAERAEEQAKKMDGVVQQHSGAVANYDATVQEINAGVAEQERLRTAYERALQNFQANENQTNADALVAAVDAFNAHVNPFNERYESTLKPNLDLYEKQAADLAAQFDIESETYNTLVTDLSVSADRVADELKPVYNELDRTFVKFMDPNFNEEEYRQIAGLDADDDAYLHWLSTGKEEGLATNMEAYKEDYAVQRQSVLNLTLDQAGLTLTDMNEFERAAFLADIDARYPTLQDLRNAPTSVLAKELLTNPGIADRAAAKDYVAGQTAITPEINDALERAGVDPGMVGEYLTQADITALKTPPTLQDAVENVGLGDGITDEDIANGTARLTVNDEGLLEWDRVQVNVPYWDSQSNRLVRRTYVEQGTELDGAYVLVDVLTGETVSTTLRFDITRPPSVVDLKDSDPSLFLDVVGSLSEAAGAIIDTQVGQAVSDFARNVVKYIQTPTKLEDMFDIIGGKELSYNNLVDVDAAVNLMVEFTKAAPTFAILKHNNACGVATRSTILDAWKDALACDHVSAFGGILISNTKIDLATATEINELFYEVLIAPSFSEEAFTIDHLKKGMDWLSYTK